MIMFLKLIYERVGVDLRIKSGVKRNRLGSGSVMIKESSEVAYRFLSQITNYNSLCYLNFCVISNPLSCFYKSKHP